MARLDNEPLAATLLRTVESSVTVDSAGGVSFSGFEFDEARVVLEDLVDLNPEVSSDQKPGFVYGALFSAARAGQLTVDGFMTEIRRREREYLAQPPVRFVLLTQISIRTTDNLPGMRIGNASISFPQSAPNQFLRARDSISGQAATALHGEIPKDYRWVRVSVHARSAGGAADHSLDALQLASGLLNLGLNRSKGMRTSFGGRRQPVNEVTLGPIHTVHRPSGAIASKTCWYEPNYVGPLRPKRFGGELEGVLAYVRDARQLMASVPYEAQVQDWIRSYGRALDERDWSTSFVRLWQTLEAVTATGTQSYSVTVKRAASIYREPEYHMAVLDRLRCLRNSMIHSGEESGDLESKLYLLKRYVEGVLEFHLRLAGTFQRPVEAAEFLDLPLDSAELVRRHRLLSRACRFREVDLELLVPEA